MGKATMSVSKEILESALELGPKYKIAAVWSTMEQWACHGSFRVLIEGPGLQEVRESQTSYFITPEELYTAMSREDIANEQ